jgi:hypothetical protein
MMCGWLLRGEREYGCVVGSLVVFICEYLKKDLLILTLYEANYSDTGVVLEDQRDWRLSWV